MAVYTTVHREQLEEFLTHYNLGELLDFQGIMSGVQNTNYFVTTTQGEYVLTLFEQLTMEELPYFLNLMAHLTSHGMPGAEPFADKSGSFLRTLNALPATIVRRLQGGVVESPSLVQVAEVARGLAAMHSAGLSYPDHHPNPYGVDWFQPMSEKVMPFLSPEQQAMLQEEVALQTSLDRSLLPEGVVHTDLFRDNVLFDGEQLSGLIDFYFACNDSLIFDVAVTVNDWCRLPNGKLEPVATRTFLQAYRELREPEAVELEMWPLMMRAASLRFWLSRLRDAHFPKEGDLTKILDPTVFQQVLEERRNGEAELRSYWDFSDQ